MCSHKSNLLYIQKDYQTWEWDWLIETHEQTNQKLYLGEWLVASDSRGMSDGGEGGSRGSDILCWFLRACSAAICTTCSADFCLWATNTFCAVFSKYLHRKKQLFFVKIWSCIIIYYVCKTGTFSMYNNRIKYRKEGCHYPIDSWCCIQLLSTELYTQS